MRHALALVTLLAACAAPDGPRPAGLSGGPARPAEVTLYRDTVTARMSDGTLCTGVREARSGPWRSVLQGCPHRWPVDVAVPPAVPRLPLVPAEGAPWVSLTPPGASPLGFAPAARVPGT